jgi:hypothetical protein
MELEQILNWAQRFLNLKKNCVKIKIIGLLNEKIQTQTHTQGTSNYYFFKIQN